MSTPRPHLHDTNRKHNQVLARTLQFDAHKIQIDRVSHVPDAVWLTAFCLATESYFKSLDVLLPQLLNFGK